MNAIILDTRRINLGSSRSLYFPAVQTDLPGCAVIQNRISTSSETLITPATDTIMQHAVKLVTIK